MGKSIAISFTHQQADCIRAISVADNVSVSAVVRSALDLYLRQPGTAEKVFPSAKNIELAGQEVGPLSLKADHNKRNR